MCRNDSQEQAAGTLFAWCGAAAFACLLMAGAFHVGVKQGRGGEGQRCVEQAVARGWIKPTVGVGQ